MLSDAGPRVRRGEVSVQHRVVVPSRHGNGALVMTSREIADVERLVASLMRSLRARLPQGLEVVELELELARRRERR